MTVTVTGHFTSVTKMVTGMLCEYEAGLSTVNISIFDSHMKPLRHSLLLPTPLLQPLKM